MPKALFLWHTWTSKQGTTLEARVVEMPDNNHLVIETRDGRRVSVSIDRDLSVTDLKFVRSAAKQNDMVIGPIIPPQPIAPDLAPLIPPPASAPPRRVILNQFPQAANRSMESSAHLAWMLATYHKLEIKDLTRAIAVATRPGDPPPAGTISVLESEGFVSRALTTELPPTPEIFKSQFLPSIRAALAADFPPVLVFRKSKNPKEDLYGVAIGYDDATSRLTIQAVSDGRYEIGYDAVAPKILCIVDLRLPEPSQVNPAELLEQLATSLPSAPADIAQAIAQLQASHVTFSLFLTRRHYPWGYMKTWALGKGPDILAALVGRHALVLMPQTPDFDVKGSLKPVTSWVAVYKDPKLRTSYNSRTLTAKGWGPQTPVSAQRLMAAWPCLMPGATYDYDLPLILVGTPSASSAETR